MTEIFDLLDKDSSLVIRQKKELDYVRGFSKPKSIRESKLIGHHLAYINIEYFSKTTPKEFLIAYTNLKDQGAAHWILDLRGNPGGDLESCLSFLEYFVPEGNKLASIEFRNGTSVYRSKNRDPYHLSSLSILVDSGTASCAELVASALKNIQKASIIGNRTQGKRTVQRIIPLNDHQWFALTVGSWKSGEERLNQSPIEPDYPLDDAEKQLKKAIDMMQGN